MNIAKESAKEIINDIRSLQREITKSDVILALYRYGIDNNTASINIEEAVSLVKKIEGEDGRVQDND